MLGLKCLLVFGALILVNKCSAFSIIAQNVNITWTYTSENIEFNVFSTLASGIDPGKFLFEVLYQSNSHFHLSKNAIFNYL